MAFPFVFLRRSVLILLLCPRFVAFSLIFPLALSFFQRNMSIFISIRLLLGEETPSFSFSSPAKVEIRVNSKQKLPVKLIFSVQNEISGEKIQWGEEGNAPKKMDFAPKVPESDEKGQFWERNHREGIERKKRTLLPILPCYEVAKWAQMNFSRIFFRQSLAGNAEMLYLCTRNREATLLQERVTLWTQRGSKSAAVIFESLT